MFYAVNIRKVKKIVHFIVVILVIVCFGCFAITCLYPVKHEELISKYAKMYGLNEAFVYGVIHTESRFSTQAQSGKGASGLMQLAKITADWGAEEIGITPYDYSMVFEPEVSIQIGCWYLAKLIKQYKNVPVALAAYNAGSGNVSQWLDNKKYSYDGKSLYKIPFGETRNYVERVKRNTKIYEILLRFYGGTND